MNPWSDWFVSWQWEVVDAWQVTGAGELFGHDSGFDVVLLGVAAEQGGRFRSAVTGAPDQAADDPSITTCATP